MQTEQKPLRETSTKKKNGIYVLRQSQKSDATRTSLIFFLYFHTVLMFDR